MTNTEMALMAVMEGTGIGTVTDWLFEYGPEREWVVRDELSREIIARHDGTEFPSFEAVRKAYTQKYRGEFNVTLEGKPRAGMKREPKEFKPRPGQFSLVRSH